MTPTQRAAAERLADALGNGPYTLKDATEAAALLRELAAEPVQAPNPLAGTMAEAFLQEIARIWHKHPDYSTRQTLDALNAMFPVSEPVQEPVAWGVFVDDELFKPFNCKDEAVDWFQAQYNHGSRYDYLVLPLYAAPQQRRPLSDEQINRLDTEAIHGGPDSQYAFRFARAVEKAHGITGEPT